MEKELNYGGIMNLIFAMYAVSCNDLLLAYKRSTKAKTEEQRQFAKTESVFLEKWFQRDPYCILSDPDRIIKGVQDKAIRGGQFHFEFYRGKPNEEEET